MLNNFLLQETSRQSNVEESSEEDGRGGGGGGAHFISWAYKDNSYMCTINSGKKKKQNPNWQNRTSTVNHREATCKRVRGAETRLGTTPMVRLTTDRRESTS